MEMNAGPAQGLLSIGFRAWRECSLVPEKEKTAPWNRTPKADFNVFRSQTDRVLARIWKIPHFCSYHAPNPDAQQALNLKGFFNDPSNQTTRF